MHDYCNTDKDSRIVSKRWVLKNLKKNETIVSLYIEVELYQEVKDEWLVSEVTSEEKITEEYHNVQFVPTEGNHITLSL